MVSINVPKRGIFTCDCKTTDEAIQFLKSKLLGAWMCVDMVSTESCPGWCPTWIERRLSSFFLFVAVVPVVVLVVATGFMGAIFQILFLSNSLLQSIPILEGWN